jgi:hypothetical protein
VLGWVVGFEPTTAGATDRSSTTELYPPCPTQIITETRQPSRDHLQPLYAPNAQKIARLFRPGIFADRSKQSLCASNSEILEPHATEAFGVEQILGVDDHRPLQYAL